MSTFNQAPVLINNFQCGVTVEFCLQTNQPDLFLCGMFTTVTKRVSMQGVDSKYVEILPFWERSHIPPIQEKIFSLKLTAIAPKNRPRAPKGNSSSNHPGFQGFPLAGFVSGSRVIVPATFQGAAFKSTKSENQPTPQGSDEMLRTPKKPPPAIWLLNQK